MADLGEHGLGSELQQLETAISEARSALRRLQRLSQRVEALCDGEFHSLGCEAVATAERLLERMEEARAEERTRLKSLLRPAPPREDP